MLIRKLPLAIVALGFAVPATRAAVARTRLAEVADPQGRSQTATPSAWLAAYAKARATLLSGNFAAAAAELTVLIETAPDAPARLLASEMLSLCQAWAAGGYVLAQPHKLALLPPPLLEDRRTTDEISILYTNAVLFGLYAGVVADVWSEPGSPGSAILPPLLFAGLSAGTVALLDRSLNLRYGVAQSIVSGLYVGVEEAVCWAVWHEASADYRSEWGEKAVTAFVLGMGITGALAGGIVGSHLGTTPGRASFMGSAAMWSALVAGTLAGGITDNDDTAWLSAATMLNVGAVAGVVAGARISPSIARVRFIDLGGLSGGLLVGGLYWTMRDRDAGPRGVLTATSLGMAAGLTAALILTRDMEPDQPRNGRALGISERLVPTLAPVASGTGFLVGVGATL